MTIAEEYKLVSRLELFEKLESTQLKRILFVSERFQVHAGEYLFRQGDSSDQVFAVLRGELSVLVHTSDREIEIALVHEGELVGEMAAISNEPRNASIRANSDCEVIGIESKLFLDTVTGDSQTALKMMQILSAKLAAVARNLGEV